MLRTMDLQQLNQPMKLSYLGGTLQVFVFQGWEVCLILLEIGLLRRWVLLNINARFLCSCHCLRNMLGGNFCPFNYSICRSDLSLNQMRLLAPFKLRGRGKRKEKQKITENNKNRGKWRGREMQTKRVRQDTPRMVISLTFYTKINVWKSLAIRKKILQLQL